MFPSLTSLLGNEKSEKLESEIREVRRVHAYTICTLLGTFVGNDVPAAHEKGERTRSYASFTFTPYFPFFLNFLFHFFFKDFECCSGARVDALAADS